MQLTDYQAKYFAYELTKRSPSDSMEKLAGAVASAQVDLNPHQVDAALFAFRSPLSKGALLADEVGLGKTIEAGLVLSQKWAEHGVDRNALPGCSEFRPSRNAVQINREGLSGQVTKRLPVPSSQNIRAVVDHKFPLVEWDVWRRSCGQNREVSS